MTNNKARIRWAIDQLNANPDFNYSVAQLMPLVEKVDRLFAQHEESEVEKARIIEEMRLRQQALNDAGSKVAEEKVKVENAYDAYRTAQISLKNAQDIQDLARISEIETALQVAQAAYELASAEYNTTEKAYMDLLYASNAVLVSTEPENDHDPPSQEHETTLVESSGE